MPPDGRRTGGRGVAGGGRAFLVLFAAGSFTVLAAAGAADVPQGVGRMDQVLDAKPADMMLKYFQAQAGRLPPDRAPCATLQDWEKRRVELRRQLWQSLGDFPLDPRPPLNPRVTGRVDRGDHVIEKVVYESLPGLYVTMLVYRPARLEGRVPAVLCVNGHWPESKATAMIQQRCVGLTRMGVIALCQDVIGAGERTALTGREPRWYHGVYRGAAPLVVGRSLTGYIMYECIRAMDYAVSRPDVDPRRVLCTGASGGGKQSLFFAALDDRLAGAVPVCWVSSYGAHMGATACLGEVPTGVLRYTDQWEILGLHAPRPLLGIAASQDDHVFAPRLMFDTLAKTRDRVYRLYGADNLVRGEEVNSRHDYNQPMRELLYNHVATYLQGAAAPHITEPPDLPVEAIETLRCGLPPESETVLSLTCRRARELAAAVPVPRRAAPWRRQKTKMLARLRTDVFGGFPDPGQVRRTHVRTLASPGHRAEHWTFETEPGVIVPAVLHVPDGVSTNARRPAVLVVDEDGKQAACDRGLVERLVKAGFVGLALDYRGTGETAGTVPAYEDVADYNLSNYALYLGRPLAGMRVFDILCAVDFLAGRPDVDVRRIAVAGRGMGAFTGMLAAAFDERIAAVAAEEMLATWVFPEEFDRIGISYLIPNILTVGDVGHLAACVAPRPLLLVNAVDGQRRAIAEPAWDDATRFTRAVFGLEGAGARLRRDRIEAGALPDVLTTWLLDVTREVGQP
jgi:dienelactone hydrolase